MPKNEAARAIRRFLHNYIEEKNGFLSGVDVDAEDKAALILANATPWPDAEKITVLFRCANSLDYTKPPVIEWIDECMAAVRNALPEAIDAAEIVVECTRATRPGLEL